LKWQFKQRLNIDPNTLQLFFDQACKKKVTATDKQLLTQAGLKHGDMLYIGNKDVVMTNVQEQAKIEEQKAEALKRLEEAKNAPPKEQPQPNAQDGKH